ncbi:GNAT family N-acetyltransferase [Streptococcus suis]|uniref:GNAT family N-acetyltransferase n=1 Tax=Streptococcus suis TaxID=1307 RepID=UPI0015542CE9|nr:GNAT family N-acetyltransferase [Streptococcus suis]NQK50362.1 GNAT family N-acetyltransferase [Streptococcus suis]NQM03503.1 GNAT family N-acetyltransferase [Streptococcus suis]HEM4137735.1 GNAT family N-acetyltransferase [Streptococcus suis]
MLDFVPVSPDNWRVPLSVSPDQAEFVADKVTTLARAFAYRIFDSQAYLIYQQDCPVGLILYHDFPERQAYLISEFFIDANFQQQGLGRQAMTQLMEKFRSERKFSAVQLCILSQNTPAKALYQSLGFVETGEYDEDEIILRLEF